MRQSTKGAVIASAVAGLLLAKGALAADMEGKQEANKVRCEGVNTCKGQGMCGGAGHDCAGKNDCKGKGWIMLSSEDCKTKGGTVAK